MVVPTSLAVWTSAAATSLSGSGPRSPGTAARRTGGFSRKCTRAGRRRHVSGGVPQRRLSSWKGMTRSPMRRLVQTMGSTVGFPCGAAVGLVRRDTGKRRAVGTRNALAAFALVFANDSNHQSLQLFAQILRSAPDDVFVLLRVEVHVVLAIRPHAPDDGQSQAHRVTCLIVDALSSACYVRYQES